MKNSNMFENECSREIYEKISKTSLFIIGGFTCVHYITTLFPHRNM